MTWFELDEKIYRYKRLWIIKKYELGIILYFYNMVQNWKSFYGDNCVTSLRNEHVLNHFILSSLLMANWKTFSQVLSHLFFVLLIGIWAVTTFKFGISVYGHDFKQASQKKKIMLSLSKEIFNPQKYYYRRLRLKNWVGNVALILKHVSDSGQQNCTFCWK